MKPVVKLVVGIAVLLTVGLEGIILYHSPPANGLPIRYSRSTDFKSVYAVSGVDFGFPRIKSVSNKIPPLRRRGHDESVSNGIGRAKILIEGLEEVYRDSEETKVIIPNQMSKRASKETEGVNFAKTPDYSDNLKKSTELEEGVPKHLLWSYRKNEDPNALGAPSNPMRGSSSYWRVGNYVHPDFTVETKEPYYYPWNDDIDYNEMCFKFRKSLSRTSSYHIIHDGYAGGLGHKFISIYYSITYALLKRHAFYLNLPDMYWDGISSCFDRYRYNETFFLASTTRAEYPDYETIERKTCEVLKAGEATVNSVIGDRNVVNYDCRLSKDILNTRENLAILRAEGILDNIHEFRWYQRILYRILLNPSPDVIQVIQDFRKKNFEGKTVFGIQVRMGGCWSDSNEKLSMMTIDELKKIPSIIRNAMSEYRYKPANTVIYLLTDSTHVEFFIKRSLSDYSIITSTEFSRSSSRTLSNTDSLKGALMDVFILADSDALFVCKGSGFGRISKYMTRAKHIIQYDVTHRMESRYNNETRSCTSYDDFYALLNSE